LSRPSPFRHDHSDGSRVPRDVRKRSAQDIAPAHCHFLGFRVSVENVERYHDALILADNHDSFVYGIDEARRAIREQHGGSRVRAIDLVYVRNLAMMEPAMDDAFDRDGIEADAQGTLSSRNGHPFTVFGILGECATHLMRVTALDALTALRIARCKCSKQFCRNFQPLDVRHAHPVTREFDALFQIMADRFMTLAGASNDTGYVH
jgi:hypothetical protein